MVESQNTVDRVETAANIYIELTVNRNGELTTIQVPVSEMDLTKEVDIERVREMGLYPDGYAINSIDLDGSITFAGYKVRAANLSSTFHLDEELFYDDGTPKTFDISVVHETPKSGDGSSGNTTETFEDCIVSSSEYSASSGEKTESTYEFMARRRVTGTA